MYHHVEIEIIFLLFYVFYGFYVIWVVGEKGNEGKTFFQHQIEEQYGMHRVCLLHSHLGISNTTCEEMLI